MKYLLGIDFGGGASKATLLSEEGKIAAEYSVEYPTLYPEAGAAEQNPKDWISALCISTKAIIENSGIKNSDIAAVAVDSATHTYLLADGSYQPLTAAFHWTDTRSRPQAERLRDSFGELIFNKTYHLPDTIWTLPQLIWLKESCPELFASAKYIFFEKDYIRYFLTDVFCTDYIEAEGSMLYDCECRSWDPELCNLAGISIEMLPPIKNPTDIVGSVSEAAATATGLAIGTPVICGTTDTAMEVFAAGAISQGDITVKLATAGRICVMTDKAYPDKHLVNYSHIKDGLWYPGTASKSAAASYRWYRDTFGGEYRELDCEAEKIPIGCDGLIFHPYLKGELTPYGDPLLCGSFTGIRATHTKAHFSRAVLEGVAMSLLDGRQYLDSLGINYASFATAIGGGTKGKLWRQILSDALGLTLKVNESSDSSFGSAMLAGVAIGIFENEEDARKKCVKTLDITYPDPKRTAEYKKLYAEYKKIKSALTPIYDGRG